MARRKPAQETAYLLFTFCVCLFLAATCQPKSQEPKIPPSLNEDDFEDYDFVVKPLSIRDYAAKR